MLGKLMLTFSIARLSRPMGCAFRRFPLSREFTPFHSMNSGLQNDAYPLLSVCLLVLCEPVSTLCFMRILLCPRDVVHFGINLRNVFYKLSTVAFQTHCRFLGWPVGSWKPLSTLILVIPNFLCVFKTSSCLDRVCQILVFMGWHVLMRLETDADYDISSKPDFQTIQPSFFYTIYTSVVR